MSGRFLKSGGIFLRGEMCVAIFGGKHQHITTRIFAFKVCWRNECWRQNSLRSLFFEMCCRKTPISPRKKTPPDFKKRPQVPRRGCSKTRCWKNQTPRIRPNTHTIKNDLTGGAQNRWFCRGSEIWDPRIGSYAENPTEILRAMLASCSCESEHRIKKCINATTIMELISMILAEHHNQGRHLK